MAGEVTSTGVVPHTRRRQLRQGCRGETPGSCGAEEARRAQAARGPSRMFSAKNMAAIPALEDFAALSCAAVFRRQT